MVWGSYFLYWMEDMEVEVVGGGGVKSSFIMEEGGRLPRPLNPFRTLLVHYLDSL